MILGRFWSLVFQGRMRWRPGPTCTPVTSLGPTVRVECIPALTAYCARVARLVLINGAPSSGKSTLARMYVNDHPLALTLDIDVVRSLLGGWLDAPSEAGMIARQMALAMARVRLLGGGDVVVPQFLGRIEFVLALESLAAEVGVRFVEVALMADREDLLTRFARRSANRENLENRDAAMLLEKIGGTDELPRMYGRLLDVIAQRPRTGVVVTVDGDRQQAYQAVLALINAD
jgi:predicted kinase